MMFSGYTDSAVQAMYLQDDGLGLAEGTPSSYDSVGPFPVKYLPICQPPSPWFANSSCPLDFIFVSEFSEQEGPKPLITIPKDPGGKLDLNDFTVRIMSVDFQTAQNESFCITEDTQVILSESQDEIYAYVHHFTLYDSNARGFVRPFCMAYVTPDHKKLISFSEEMSKEFYKVSRYLKYGNMLMFVKDMTHYLTDLQYTRERLVEMSHEQNHFDCVNMPKNSAESDVMKAVTLETINSCIQDVKNILEKASSQLTDKELEALFQQYEDKHKLKGCDDDTPLSASYSAAQSSPKINKFLPRLSKSGSYSEMSQALSHQVPRNDIYKPKLVRTLNRRRFDHILRNLHELCGWGAKEGLRRLRSIHKFYSRSLAVLEIEREDSQLTVPQSSLLTIGRLAILNFFSCDSIDLGVGECTLNDRIFSQSVGSNMRRWLSDETLASINSFDSSVCGHEDDTQLVNGPGFILGSSFLEHRGSCASVEFCQTNNTDSGIADSGASFSAASDDKISIGESMISELSDYKDPADLLARTVSIVSPADHLANLTPHSIGYGILAFTNQFAFAPHVFYSLLTGRAVIVLGSTKMERDVRNVIKALTLLVPGHSHLRHAVVPWQHKPVRMADLAKVKLVGLCKPERRNSQIQTQNSVRKFVSILDLDRKTYDGPAYKGDFLTAVCNKRKSFKSERTFLAILNSMLMELALKSTVYYHSFCMKSKRSEVAEDWEDPGDSQLHRVKSQAFLAGLSLRTHDGNIVQYLAEVVSGQQLEEMSAFTESQNIPSCPVVSLRFETCGTFKA